MIRYDNPLDISAIGAWDEREPARHGPAEDAEFVWPGRRVAQLHGHTWPHTPETCTAGQSENTWHLDGQVLLCDGCGIDGT